MKGAVKFERAKFLIRLLIICFRILPVTLRKLLWSLTSIFDGAIAAGVRYCLLSADGAKLGDNVYIGAFVTLKNPQFLSVANNCSIHNYCYIDALGGVKLGNDVSIAHNCSLVSFNHTWSDENKAIKYNDVTLKSISIGDDVWLGCGVRLLAGAIIGERTIVAAGAVVTEGAYNGGVYGGVPAKRLINE